MIIVGATISAISLFGFIGSCCRVNFALTLYLILLFLLLLCLVGFMVFAILVTNESIGKSFSKTKIMDFHNWLRDNLVSYGFVSNNAMLWNRPKTSPTMKHSDDCAAWSNHQNTLCFNCESCKAAYVVTSTKQWGQLAIANAYFVAFTVILYSIGYCVRSNNQKDSHHRYRGYP
ncbi:hypothetical protein D5086_028168 [Populus alba]|uniref:Uncharacterized protein n=1 Tax=Populus alba TaxID=43335 RepID=A0ACC4AY08_POPAL